MNEANLQSGYYNFSANIRDIANHYNSTETRTVIIINDPQSKKFNIQNNSGATVASIDSSGNMYIKGVSAQNQLSLIAPINSFIVENSAGTVTAYIDNAGSLFLKGTISTQSDLSGQTSSNLEIRNSTNGLVAFFDNIGNLKLKGALAEGYANP
jgi:hypothetical protein